MKLLNISKYVSFLLLIIIFIWLVIYANSTHPELDQQTQNNDAKVNLHNLYIFCLYYWREEGVENSCSIDIATQSEYGYIPSKNINVAIESGEKVNFSATASHKNTKNIFVIDSEGRITEKDK